MTTTKTGLTDKFRPPATKVCRLCKEDKPVKEFARNSRGRSGYANECRACNREQENKKTEQQKENAKTFFDAKFFTLLLLLSTSYAFSQDSTKLDTAVRPAKTFFDPMPIYRITPEGILTNEPIEPPAPDTLRAYILATMCRKCAAEAMPGFVVIEQGKRPVYLDCKKRALKWPQVGWGYELVNPNYK